MPIFETEINMQLVRQGPEAVKRVLDRECGSDRQLGADVYFVHHGAYVKLIRLYNIIFFLLMVVSVILILVAIGIVLLPLDLIAWFFFIRDVKKTKKNWEQGYELWQRSLPTP